MSMELQDQQLCFIGAGAIAEAIMRGLIQQHKLDPAQIAVVNRSNTERGRHLQEVYQVRYCSEQAEKERAIRSARMIILAIKPRDVEAALVPLKRLFSKEQLFVSVIAGWSLAALSGFLPADAPLVRTMPNTSSAIGLGVTAVSFAENVPEPMQRLVKSVFESVGIVEIMDEAKMDIATALSGSGPAYIYYVMEAMIEGGIAGGLPREMAKNMAVQTVLGAAQMVRQTNREPDELRRQVTSPGGTTQAALECLQQREVAEAIKQAMARAAARARELGS